MFSSSNKGHESSFLPSGLAASFTPNKPNFKATQLSHEQLDFKTSTNKGRASHELDHFWADPVLPGCIFRSDPTRLLAPELRFNFFNLRMGFSRSFADKPMLGTTKPWSNTIPTSKHQGASVNELQLGPMQHQMGFLPGSVRAAMGFSRCSRPTCSISHLAAGGGS